MKLSRQLERLEREFANNSAIPRLEIKNRLRKAIIKSKQLEFKIKDHGKLQRISSNNLPEMSK